MRINLFISVGAVLTVLGLIGLIVIFPKFIATGGQDFVDQIDTSKGFEEYNDYEIGDSVIIVDEIARIELNEGQTYIWLDSIGKSQNDPPFRFSSNLMSDYGVGNKVIITFEVVKDSTGDYTLNGYQNGGSGLSSDSIQSRYSTTSEYSFILLIVVGIGSIVYGIYSNFGQKKITTISDGGWGSPVTPVSPPPVAPPFIAQPPVGVPPTMAAPLASVTEPMSLAPPPPVVQAPSPSSMNITVPPGVVPGQILTVTMPSGMSVNVQVPPGCMPGSQFMITVT